MALFLATGGFNFPGDLDLRVLDLVDADLLLFAREPCVWTIGGIERALKFLGGIHCLWDEFDMNK
jgi:hypothetical protein